MEDHFLDIEAYLDGRMTVAEKIDFEIQLENNAGLRASLEEIRKLRSDLAWHYASNDVAAANQLRREYQRRRWIRLTFLLGLLVVTLAGFFIWWNGRTPATTGQPALPPAQIPTVADPDSTIPAQDNSRQAPPPALKSPPMAGNFKKEGASPNDVYRDLPAEKVSAVYQQFFVQQMKTFKPAVEPQGVWAPAVNALVKSQPAAASGLLKKVPAVLAGNDTTIYLQAVAALQLQRPDAAETLLYPLANQKNWQAEGRYLLVWVYLLRGETELAMSALKLLPADYRDKKEIAAFLQGK